MTLPEQRMLRRLGRKVRRFRAYNEMSLADVGAKIGDTQGTLYGIEAGDIDPSLLTISRIARAFGVTADELLRK